MPAESTLRDRDAAQFELIETLRWDPAEGFIRLERHLGRLYASAGHFGFQIDPTAVGKVLGEAIGERVPLRVRLTLSADGDLKCATQPFEPIPPGKSWIVRIAATRLDAADPLLHHKTTRRGLYERARGEFAPHEANEMILLNGDRQVCEGTITNVFLDAGDDGPLLTPALACGLLPGILRAVMLEDGKAREAVLTAADLRSAKALFVGNSLRGLIPASLA